VREVFARAGGRAGVRGARLPVSLGDRDKSVVVVAAVAAVDSCWDHDFKEDQSAFVDTLSLRRLSPLLVLRRTILPQSLDPTPTLVLYDEIVAKFSPQISHKEREGESARVGSMTHRVGQHVINTSSRHRHANGNSNTNRGACVCVCVCECVSMRVSMRASMYVSTEWSKGVWVGLNERDSLYLWAF